MHYFADGLGSAHLADRLGHYAHLFICTAIVGVVIVGLYPLPGALALTVPLLLLVTVLGSWLLMRQHDRRLCEQCAATIPLNPGAQAEAYQRRFWVAHAAMEPRYLLPYLAVLIGSNFETSQAGRIAWALIQCTMIYLIVSHATHRRLQPWCPRCQGGDGRDDRDDVAPPPPPVDRRLLV
ncbi:MAG: hypothetical protein EPN43_04940 [Jatrophihabitans sp.]|nr:MAG: hypothetical protein EPN43_04940 [Jatrophihabitans sp.]